MPEKELIVTLSPFANGSVAKVADAFARSPNMLLYPEKIEKPGLDAAKDAAVSAAYREACDESFS